MKRLFRSFNQNFAVRLWDGTTLRLGEVSLSFTHFTAIKVGTPLHLTPKEWALLKLLAELAGQPVTRQRALDVVWGVNAFPTTRTVDTHIACLRSKLEADPENPRHLRTVHGIGYMLTFTAPPS